MVFAVEAGTSNGFYKSIVLPAMEHLLSDLYARVRMASGPHTPSAAVMKIRQAQPIWIKKSDMMSRVYTY